MQTNTSTNAPSDISARQPDTGREHRTLILRSRLDPVLRRLLPGLGARVEPLEWRGFVGPKLDRVTGPSASNAPECLDADGAEALIELLRRMESQGGSPRWVHQMLSSYRAGALLQRDGTLELGGELDAPWLLGELLRLPGRRDAD